MSAQTSYNQKMSHGVAGGLYDLTNHTVDTRTNEETDGKTALPIETSNSNGGRQAG